jgi:hypothetical protein
MNMGTMHDDALRELSELSLELQKRETTLPDANSAISSKIKVLKSMCSIPGEYVKCSSKAVSQKKFQEVKLQNYPKVIEIYRSGPRHSLGG